jgi:hypothetical protein
MPLVHHTLGTDGYHYISTASNFFARSVGFQVLAWTIAAALALGITRLRTFLAQADPPAGS